MSDKFHDEIALLKTDVLDMAHFARNMLSDSMKALVTDDEGLAADVKKRKQELNDRHETMEEHIFQMIALYQPVAKDMRSLVCALQVVNDSMRIGRYGKDIANTVKEIFEQPVIGNFISLPHMSELAISMIDDAILSYDREDITLIEGMSKRDDVVDSLRASIFRECLTYMMEDPGTISRCIYYVMIARYLERCADHGCKIAEKVYYMQTGERIEIK
ncbi:MAG TPA: phosphate signaling complex protein PhoU [Methanoregulaceae archaeon]|nr:phosphate signaling complex protein PhoU [Methanoregulaceae archaeon]